MWDAHVSQWTEAAIAAGERRAITSFGDLSDLVERGLVQSFEGSTGVENGFVANLRATGHHHQLPRHRAARRTQSRGGRRRLHALPSLGPGDPDTGGRFTAAPDAPPRVTECSASTEQAPQLGRPTIAVQFGIRSKFMP
jgi:hypothetical protein